MVLAGTNIWKPMIRNITDGLSGFSFKCLSTAWLFARNPRSIGAQAAKLFWLMSRLLMENVKGVPVKS